MKITVSQTDLQKALSLAANVIPAKTPMPNLSCVLLEATDSQLSISATSLDQSLRTKLGEVQITEPGKAAVPAAKLVSFVRSLPAGEVSIEEKDGTITVRSGKSMLSETGMNPDSFPAFPDLGDATGSSVPADILVEMIRSTSYAVSKDETRPALMGILWEIKPTGLAMVATDAHRLARCEYPLDWGVTEIRNDIADTAGMLHLLRIAEGAESVEVFFGDRQMSFRVGATELHTRVMEGPFPDYNAVIPRENDLRLTVDRESMISAVRRVSITADRITSQIRLGIEAGRMELSAIGSDGSRAEDEIPIGYEGSALEIGFNYNYLLDVLKNIPSDNVEIALKDPQSAALFHPVGDDLRGELICLLMPLRLTGD